MQSLLRALYPTQCLSCEAVVDTPNGLCGACWAKTPFVTGLPCDRCGVPLPGDDTGQPELCDDCLTIARPWQTGRAAMLYADNGRKLVLRLKHGDRPELAKGAATWMARTGQDALQEATLLAPIPLHWRRLLTRRYNQSAELAHCLSHITGIRHIPDLLKRTRATGTQDGRGRDGRFTNMAGAIVTAPKRRAHIQGQTICLIDDVMTSGATFAVATDACLAAGAKAVTVLALARVTKSD